MIVITETGSRYLYREDTVTRMSEIPIHGLQAPLVQEQVSWAAPIVRGERWTFDTARGRITTSRVVSFDFEAQVLD